MKLEELLAELSKLNVKLWINDDQLGIRAPKGVLTKELSESLAKHKVKLLSLLKNQTLGHALLPITAVNRNDLLPLSFAQQRIWFLDQLEGKSATYNIPTALKVEGSLNIGVLEKCLSEIVKRHEALRTNFKLVDGIAYQQILKPQPVNIRIVDIQQVGEQNLEAEIERLIGEEAKQSFDLSGGFLIRAAVIKWGGKETKYGSSVLLFTVHHIASDGWSIGILIRELCTLYKDFLANRPSSLPELSIQYADYAYWQRNSLKGEVLEKQIQYWKNQLATASPYFEIPTDRPRLPLQSFRGDIESFEIDLEMMQLLKKFSQQHSVTLFMTLMSAFVVLLARYSRNTEISVGTLIANRNKSEIEGVMGFFVNTLVLRIAVNERADFLNLLSKMKQVALEAYANQDVPFEQVVDAVKPPRSLSFNPLFQVMFLLQNAPIEKLELPGLTLTPIEISTGTSKFDLLLSINETKDGLKAWFEYNTDLFDACTIRQMALHFKNILGAIITQPQCPVSELPLLTQDEKARILNEWNDTKQDYPQDKCFHQLFEEQVERSPYGIAVVCEGRSLSYYELNTRANRLARVLTRQGIKRGMIVALLAERDIDFLVTMLAIFKSGGVYLPLDPHQPVARLSTIIKQSSPGLILTEIYFRSTLEEAIKNTGSNKKIPVFFMNEQLYAEQSGANLALDCSSIDLAYIIYTSGTTGVPKGVMIEHKGMLNHLYAKIEVLHIDKNDIVAQTAIQSFDISIWQFLAVLLTGGQVHILKDPVTHEPSRLFHTIVKHKITILEIVPSLLGMLLKEISLGNISTDPLNELRWLILTGESLPPDLCRRWLQLYPFVPIVNAYGPTECSDDVTHYIIDKQPSSNETTIPIGKPIANTQIYLLDELLQPVPVGVIGELYIGGDGVGRGYFDNETLTNKFFIPDPFLTGVGKRLYKSGDRARFRADGNIEFFGRIDHQVKIRGFRIELGEIEAALLQYPHVHQVTVVVRENQSGDKRLVAYIIPHQNQVVDNAELRDFLKGFLVEYMIPSAFILLERFPLLSNGKIDLAALPNSDFSRSTIKQTYTAPRNELEAKLVEIWEKLLDTHPVGVLDNFFELGGHSILAFRVMAEIQQQLGKTLPLTSFFQNATIEHQAGILNQRKKDECFPGLVTIQPNGDQPPLFFAAPKSRNGIFSYFSLANHLNINRPIYSIEPEYLNSRGMHYISERASYNIQALQTLQPEGPYYIGGWSTGGLIALEMAQQLIRSGHEIAFLALIDTHSPYVAAEINKAVLSAINRPEVISATRTPGNNPYNDNTILITFLIHELEKQLGEELKMTKWLQHLEYDEKMAFILKQAKSLNIISQDAELNEMEQLLKDLIANIYIEEHYEIKQYPGRITLFCSSEPLLVSRWNSLTGWDHISANLQIHKIPGNHYSIFKEPNVRILASALKMSLMQTTEYAMEK